MTHPFLPVLVALLFGSAFAAVFLLLSAIIGPKVKGSHQKSKLSVYECGLPPIGTARERIDIKFSLVAMLFILFDIEAVFLFPWAVLYRDFIREGMGVFMLVEMGSFLAILAIGLVYIWKKGALDWK